MSSPLPQQKSADEYLDIATGWARQVIARPKKNCKFIRHVAGKFIAELSRPPKGHYMSDIHILRFCRFAEALPHVKGAQFHGNLQLAPWQVFHFINIFGWVDDVFANRKHSVAFTMIAKKNGKSTMAAPVGAYLISPLENERGAEVYCAASKRAQARIVLDVTRQMINSSARLKSELNMSVWAHHVECEIGGVVNKMSALASDSPDSDDGINPSGVILDELHAMRDGKLRTTLIKGTAARQNSLVYQISTAGKHSDQSPCVQEYDYAQKWAKGEIDAPWFFGMIFEQDDWTAEIKKPKTWCKSNPNMGITFARRKIKEQLSDSEKSPLLRNIFVQKHLNAFTSQTQSWLAPGAWENAQAKIEDMPVGLPLHLGLDLSNILDLTGIGMVWVDDSGDDAAFWCAAECFATQRGIDVHETLKEFHLQGLLEIIGERSIKQSAIKHRILDIVQEEDVVDLGYDPWNAENLAYSLAKAMEPATVAEVRQGARTYSAPLKAFQAGLDDGLVKIIGDDCLSWQAGNLDIKIDDNGNFSPIKDTKKNKIDGVIAILIAFVMAWRSLQGEDDHVTADDIFPDI